LSLDWLKDLETGARGSRELAAELNALAPDARAEALNTIIGSYRRKTILLDAAESLGGQLDLSALIQSILARTSQLLQADRCSLFLLDRANKELWMRLPSSTGEVIEVRFPMDRGLAGHVATTGEVLNIPDAYEHKLFNREVDLKTGYRTKTVLCVPIRNKRAEIVGVLQAINRKQGLFDAEDIEVLHNLSSILALALENSVLYDHVLSAQREVATLLDVANSLSQNLDLTALIQAIMKKAGEILGADRSTLFLIDHEKKELWSKVAQGMTTSELRFPMDRGLAGHVATTGEILNIPDAYEHKLFNREIDKLTGYRTRTILCMPIRRTDGVIIGVTQVINKREGLFTEKDERLLGAFSAQSAIAIDNAQLYERVRAMKDYLESILDSVTNGVLTVNPQGHLATANASARRVLAAKEKELESLSAEQLFQRVYPKGVQALKGTSEGHAFLAYDLDFQTLKGDPASMNLNIVPLLDAKGSGLGQVIVLEDVTSEKRMKSNLSRFMSREIVDQMLGGEGKLALGGKRQEVSVLFSDIRSYTSLTEGADAAQIVEMLNEYFTHMVDAVFHYEGILDKFIGDALMAIFGAPFAKPETDPVNAVLASLEMYRQLDIFNKRRVEQNKKPIAIGIGISTGEVLCGNIGSEKRMEYTAIGDGVNLASRLEGATKQYGVNTMISEFTHRKVKDKFIFRDLDRIRVMGKKEPVNVFDVIAEKSAPLDDQTKRKLEQHDKALHHYRERAWKLALAEFEAAHAAHPTDKSFKIYITRCKYFLEHPPGAEWDGVWALSEK